MNQFLFYIRLLASFGFSIGSIVEFSSGNQFNGYAELSIAIVIAIPALIVLFTKRKLTPGTDLHKNWDTARMIKMARIFIGFSFACGSLDASLQKEGTTTGFLITGLFLISPLSDIVFGHRTQSPADQLKPNWIIRWAILTILQSIGVLMFMVAFSYLFDEIFDGFIVVSLIGIFFILTRQLGKLFFKNKNKIKEAQFSIGSIQPETMRSIQPEAKKSIQPEVKSSIEPEEKRSTQPEVKNSSLSITIEAGIDLTPLKAEYFQLNQLNAQKRGYAFQDFLKKFFDAHLISARAAFRLVGEEIDGSFEMESQIYLLEAKWQEKPCSQSELLIFSGKVEGKSMWARGLFISHAGFTSDGLKAFAMGKRTSIIGMDGNDLLLILDGQVSLEEAIKLKVRRAAEHNEFFAPLEKLLRA